jgi:hypothetical protein
MIPLVRTSFMSSPAVSARGPERVEVKEHE